MPSTDRRTFLRVLAGAATGVAFFDIGAAYQRRAFQGIPIVVEPDGMIEEQTGMLEAWSEYDLEQLMANDWDGVTRMAEIARALGRSGQPAAFFDPVSVRELLE